MNISDKLRNRPTDNSNKSAPIEPVTTNVQAPKVVQEQDVKPKLPSITERLNEISRTVENEYNKNNEKAERAHKASALITGIGDGISSLANLYYTTKGAPSARIIPDLPRFNEEYRRVKERRDAEKERLKERMLQLSMREGDQARADAMQQKAWDRQDKKDADNIALSEKRYQDEKQYRAGRDAAGDDFRNKQMEQQDRQFKAQQNTQREKIAADQAKEEKRTKNRAYYNFVNKYGSNGSIQPVEVDGTTYRVTPKFLSGYLGNMTSDMLTDIRDKEFGGKSEEEIMTNASDRIKYKKHQERYKANSNLLTTLLTDAAKSPRLQATIKKAEEQFQRSLTAAEGGWDIGEQNNTDDDFEQYTRSGQDEDFNQFIRK